MALPPIDMSADLEAEAPEEDFEGDDLEPLESDVSADLDPMFAADIYEALPDLDDAQVAALQRAVLGLISGGGAPPVPPLM
jgi:hypothetical protein